MLAAYILATGRLLSKFRWRHPAQCRMGTSLVMAYAPGPDFAPRILQGHEPVLVQALLAQPAVERLHRGIVRWCSRPGKVYTDPPVIHPLVQHFSCKFRAVIGFQQL